MKAMAVSKSKIKWLVGLILVLYILILLGPQMLLAAIGIKDPLLSLIDLAIQVIFWLAFIPLITKIPEGSFSIGKYLRFIRISAQKPAPKNLILGVLIGVVSISCFGLLSIAFFDYSFDLKLILPPQSWRLLWANTGAIFEEIAIRGVILSLLLLIYEDKKALVISAVIFGLGHYLTFFLGDTLLESSIRVIYAILLGLVFGSLAIKTNSLYPSMIAHILINSLSSSFAGGSAMGADIPFLISTILTLMISYPLINFFNLQKKPAAALTS